MSTSPRISIVFLQGAASTGQSDANPRVPRSSDVRRPAASMQSATYLRVLSTQNWPHRKGSGAASFGRGQFGVLVSRCLGQASRLLTTAMLIPNITSTNAAK